jgi:hypothetical protein
MSLITAYDVEQPSKKFPMFCPAFSSKLRFHSVVKVHDVSEWMRKWLLMDSFSTLKFEGACASDYLGLKSLLWSGIWVLIGAA